MADVFMLACRVEFLHTFIFTIIVVVSTFKGIGKAKSHFLGIFKSFKSIISGVIQLLGYFFHVVG